MRVTNHDEFMEAMEKYADKWAVLGVYKAQKEHIEVRCLACDSVITVRASSLMGGTGCKHCRVNGKYAKTHEDFVAEAKKANPHLEILGRYRRGKEHIECRCVYCGDSQLKAPDMILYGNKCRKCANSMRTISTEEMKGRIYKVNKKVLILGKNITYDEYVEVQCLTCDKIYETTGRTLLGGHGCAECSRRVPTDKKMKINKLLSKLPSPQIILEDYTKLYEHVSTECTLCGYVRKARVRTLTELSIGCPMCTQSSNEKKITNILKEMGVTFTIEHKFEDATTPKGSHFKFDFYIPSCNVIIEYDGIRHFKPLDVVGGKEQFATVQEYDKLKNDYARRKGITLIRLNDNMSDAEIEEIVNQHVS